MDKKTDARIRILRNAADVCGDVSDEVTAWMAWSELQHRLNKAADTLEAKAADDRKL